MGVKNYRLIDAIYDAGYTISSFRIALRIPKTTMNGYVYDGYEPTASRAAVMAKALGREVGDLWRPKEEVSR